MNAMLTPYHLLLGLAQEMRQLFATVRMGDGRESAVNVYEQSLPASTAADDEPEYAPWCIVRLTDGSANDANTGETVNVILLFCVQSAGLDRQGYADVMHLMQLAKQYLFEHPVVAQAFAVRPESLSWMLQTEDSMEYYIGGITVSFDAPPIIRNAPPLD